MPEQRGSKIYTVTLKSGSPVETRADSDATTSEGELRLFVDVEHGTETVARFAPGQWMYVQQERAP